MSDKPVTMEALAAPDKKAEKERKKAEAAAKRAAKKAGKDGTESVTKQAGEMALDVSDPSSNLTAEQVRVASNRAVTGVLASTAAARDVKFESFSVAVGGKQLVSDCKLELTQGCRYGLLGDNGSGKSNVLSAIAQREVPLPSHISVFHLHEEAPPSDMSGVEAVIHHVKEEVERLEAMSEAILEEVGPEDERLEAINDRLSELDPTGAEPRARKILSGLGFADHLVPMDRPTKAMSGGWRMRVSLAQALFAAPELLLLDEPTNHLDLEACVWLEEHLATYPKCLLVVSHSQDFLNAVCNHTMWLSGGTLKYYGGNYANFVATVQEEERLQLKVWEKQQADMEKLSDFVRVNKGTPRPRRPCLGHACPATHPSRKHASHSIVPRSSPTSGCATLCIWWRQPMAWPPRPSQRRKSWRSSRMTPSRSQSCASRRSPSSSQSARASRRRCCPLRT